MVFTAVSCGKNAGNSSDSSIYQIYKSAYDKMVALNDLAIRQKINQDITLKMAGQTYPTVSDMEIDVRATGITSGDLLFYNHTLTKANGSISSDIDLYADKDNIYYKDLNTSGYETYSRSDPNFSAVNDLLSSEELRKGYRYAESDFAGATMTENSDGSKTIKFSPDAVKLKTETESQVNTVLSSMKSIGASDLKYEITSVEMELTISKDGYIISTDSSMVIDISMTVSGMSATSTSNASTHIDYLDPGQPVIVTIPNA